jgi:hypothetical protein
MWELIGLGRDLRAAVDAGRVQVVPACTTSTQVPFAFPTEATARALAPYMTPNCQTSPR